MDMTMKDGHYKALAYEQFKRLAKSLSDSMRQAGRCRGRGVAPYRIGCPAGFRLLRPAGYDQQSERRENHRRNALYLLPDRAADRVVMTSSMQFATVINEHMISTGRTAVRRFAPAVEHGGRTRKTELYAAYEKICNKRR